MKSSFVRYLCYFLGALALVIFAVIVWGLAHVSVKEAKIFGATYSGRFAAKFGLERKKIFLAVLDELKTRRIRIPIYWDEVERSDGRYDFSEIDFYLAQAQKRDAKIILAVGRKLPRWPECFRPDWVLSQDSGSGDFEKKKLLDYIRTAARRYKDNPALLYWQVENEPFLPFGGSCPLLGGNFLNEEIAAVKKIDGTHPVLITDSGELSFWVSAARRADVFGTTMYRTIWNKNLGYFTYPLPPWFFRVRRAVTEFFAGAKSMLVSELQAEPWEPKQLYELSPEFTLSHFNLKTFQSNIAYAKKSGFDEFYLWGVEWWYWLKFNGHPEIWNEAKSLFNRS